MFRLKLLRTLVVLVSLFSQKINAQDANILSIAKAYLNEKNQGLSKIEALDFIITDQTFNSKNGVTYVYIRQTFQGIEIINANSNMAFKDGKIVHQTGKVITKLTQSNVSKMPSVSATEAIHNVASHLSLSITEPLSNQIVRTDNPNYQQFSTGGISLEPIPVKLVYWLNEDGELRLAYDLSIYPKDQENWWSIKIDAENGVILEQGNWVTKCQFDTDPHEHGLNKKHRNTTTGINVNMPSNAEQYNVYPYPIESPNHGDASLIVAPHDQTYSPYGWHDTNGLIGAEFTITRGNNVHAYEDIADEDTPGFSPDGGANLNFNFAANFALKPSDYQSASITNLFYWNNIIHDIFSHYGFDEESGNFQTTNYSGEGVGNDAVRAEDQDGSGTDNANFGTPPEGSAPRMQMYLWESSEGGFEVTINSPAAIAGTYSAKGATFGGTPTSGFSGNLVLVADGSGSPSEGCNSLINSSSIAGKIAVVDRGNCAFVQKAQIAQNAGAIALLVLNNTPDDPIIMGGENAFEITIPLLMVSQATGALIKANLPGINVTFEDNRKYITSSYDNGIITHEYGHGISTRLTGGASNSGCLGSAEQMGEGWSDYFALILTMENDDQGSDSRGIGTYAASQLTTGNGIRPAPYSTNLAVNDYTYDNLNDANISQPHGIGFLWCTMIWDMTWLMIERYGYDPDIYTGNGGNNKALQLVIDGLKLQPCNPGFVDGRDAILLADRLNNNGANQDIIWEAFARRGLGAFASQGSSNDRGDGVVSFDIPNPLLVSSKMSSLYIETGDFVTYEITVENIFNTTQNNVEVSYEIPEGIAVIENSISSGGVLDGSFVIFSLDQLAGGETTTFSFETEIISEEGTIYQLLDDHENGTSNWIASSESNNNIWALSETSAKSGAKSWFISNPDGVSQQTLTMAINLPATENSKLAFWHSYNTEAEFDGGVIEISTNDGNSWTDLGSKIITHGYDTRLQSGSSNPLSGRKAFTGSSQGYIKTIADLGDYEGSNIKIRFVFVSDIAVGGDGWYIDDVFFFEDEEISIFSETCIVFESHIDPICFNNSSLTLLSSETVCTVNAGKIVASSNPPITVCDEGESEFSVSNNSVSTAIQYRYFITNSESPYNILLTSSTGSFDHTTLNIGNYEIWGFAYSNENSEEDVDSFLAIISNIDEISSSINTDEICGALTNTSANFVTTQLIKQECSPLSVNNMNNSILVYPNPNRGRFTIELIEGNKASGILEVLDVTGRSIYSNAILDLNRNGREKIDLSKLKSGLYFVQIELDNKKYLQRIVIQ